MKMKVKFEDGGFITKLEKEIPVEFSNEYSQVEFFESVINDFLKVVDIEDECDCEHCHSCNRELSEAEIKHCNGYCFLHNCTCEVQRQEPLEDEIDTEDMLDFIESDTGLKRESIISVFDSLEEYVNLD